MKHVFISAGEPSGDMHAAKVVRRLSGLRLSGIGGDAMIGAGVTPFAHIRDTAVLGFFEVFLEYAKLRRLFYEACFFLRREKVDLLVLVDFPGFNLRLAAYAHAHSIPVLYYIAPKAWAWGEGRVRKMARVIDRLAVIFPFEEAWFKARGINARYVGHPLMEESPAPPPRGEVMASLGLLPDAKVIGLFPGSRPQEVSRMMGPLSEAARLLIGRGLFDAAVVARAPGIPESLLRGAGGPPFKVYSGAMHALQSAADFLIVKSGTANLEAALAGTPLVVVYKTSPITYFLGRRLVRVPYLNPINLLCNAEAVPEFLQGAATPQALAKAVAEIVGNPGRVDEQRRAFDGIRSQLGLHPASVRVAALIEEMLHG